jgi:hypothetical protein
MYNYGGAFMRAIAKAKDPAHTIRFPRELLRGLRQSAQKNGRSLNSEVIWVLRQGMKTLNENNTTKQNQAA